MPRLPTMRVIGSQFISTSLRDSVPAARCGVVIVVMALLFPFSRQSAEGGRQQAEDEVAGFDCLLLSADCLLASGCRRSWGGSRWSAAGRGGATWVPC